MNKNKYVTPSVSVMTVKAAGLICTSVTGDGDAKDIKWGGSGAGKEAASRQGRFWDEE